jgi:V/A-type H+-transporting ATPase subunit D
MSLVSVRPTKGYLIEMKKRIHFVERGCEFLKMKRDHLAKELRDSLDVLRGQRRLLIESLKEVYDLVTAAYLALGSTEVISQSRSVRKDLEIDVLPLSVMGVLYPMVKVKKRSSLSVELDLTLERAAEKMNEILEQLIHLAEFESRTERIADELGKTNRKVNSLEDVVIPQYHRIISFIEDKIDEEGLEELVRTKLIGGSLSRRRE